jgi:hypothetical protein
VSQLHFDPTYSLMAIPGVIVSNADPYWILSYAFLFGSAIFLYRGCRALLNTFFAALFLVTLFVWDFHSRSFDYASELFTIPWNNQPLFFAFAFFFWLYATRDKGPVSMPLAVVTGVICGALATTREESVLFLVPLAIFYLAYRRAPWRAGLYAAIAAVLAGLPGFIIKSAVLGSPWSIGPNRPGSSYEGTASGYFSLGRLGANLRDVVFNSHFASVDAARPALLQAAPWFWLAPIGLIIVLFGKRWNPLMKWFVVMSIALMGFYLSGNNMSALKLKFHCLRYIAPGFIALAFGTIVVLATLWDLVKPRRSPTPRARTPQTFSPPDPEPAAMPVTAP